MGQPKMQTQKCRDTSSGLIIVSPKLYFNVGGDTHAEVLVITHLQVAKQQRIHAK